MLPTKITFVSNTMAPTLYMNDFSPPVRSVFLTAKALGLELDKKMIDLAKKEHLTEEYLKVSTLSKFLNCIDSKISR